MSHLSSVTHAKQGAPLHKKSTEEIAAGQPSAAEPGGAVGAQDPLAGQPPPQAEGKAGEKGKEGCAGAGGWPLV